MAFVVAACAVLAGLATLLALRLREQGERMRLVEERSDAFYAFTRELAGAQGLQASLDVAARQLDSLLDADIVLLLPDEKGRLEARASSGAAREVDSKDRGVAQWVLESGRPAGLGTDTLSDASAQLIPLAGSGRPSGALWFRPRIPGAPSREELLGSLSVQVGLVLEVVRFREDARQSQLEAEKERLRASLLSSVSHDLRTPLAGIIGSASFLLQPHASLSKAKEKELLATIQAEGERLSKLVHNLIETTRLEAGVRLRKEPNPIEELVGSALERVSKLLEGRDVATDLPEDLPLVPLDGMLVEQVLVNLLENAARHAPGGPIEVSARAEDGFVLVEVADRGPGLKADELERVFEKFYHAKSPAAGAGLGLAICRAVVDAHGGRIWAENRPGGGAAFRFTLPLEGGHGRE